MVNVWLLNVSLSFRLFSLDGILFSACVYFVQFVSSKNLFVWMSERDIYMWIQICPLKRDKFEFRTFFCSCHTCSCLVIVVECFLQPQSQIFRDFLNFVHLTSDWTKFNGTQFETEIPCTDSGISVLVSNECFDKLLFEVLKLMSFSFA